MARSPRRATVIALYAVAAGLGYLIGTSGVLPFGGAPPSASLSRARVGWVLGQPDPQSPPDAWAALEADVTAVDTGWPTGAGKSTRTVFDLVAAVRGLKTGGKSDWDHAEQLCRSLKWSRCDRAALEELRAWSRP